MDTDTDVIRMYPGVRECSGGRDPCVSSQVIARNLFTQTLENSATYQYRQEGLGENSGLV